MIVLVYVCLLVSIVYNTYVICYYNKVPESLSETAYLFGGNKRFLFTAYCTVCGGLLFPSLVSITPEGFEFLPFLITSGLCFAGFSPIFKEGLEGKVHYISAIIAFLGFILYVINFLGMWWFIGFVVALGGLCLWKSECVIYFAENLALSVLLLWLIFVL